MKRGLLKSILIMSIMLLMSASAVMATSISDPSNGEENLYKIVNKMLETAFTSSNSIPNQVSDSSDNYWQFSDGQVVVEVRYAGYDQELGLVRKSDNGYMQIVPREDIKNGIYRDGLSYKIEYYQEFAFVEKYWNGTSAGKWYSDDRNSNGSYGSVRFDHFVAFDVTNLGKYAGSTAINKAYIIAWEDLIGSASDKDYNDLVCLVLDVKPTFAEEVIIDAEAEAGRVVISWAAISETEVLGYNIYRAKGFAGTFEKINDDLIMGKGSIETTVEYEFIDDTVDNGMLYQYKIEEVGTNGLSFSHERVKVVPRFVYNYFR